MEDGYSAIYDEYGEEHSVSKCRLCACTDKAKYFVNIFGKRGMENNLDIKIRKCLPIMIREDDGMPKGVCINCVCKLDVCWELVEASLRAHHEFLSIMANDPARIEHDRRAVSPDEDSELSEVLNLDEDPSKDVNMEDFSEADVATNNPPETNPQEEFDINVTIKDEPIDMDEVQAEAEQMNFEGSEHPVTNQVEHDETSSTALTTGQQGAFLDKQSESEAVSEGAIHTVVSGPTSQQSEQEPVTPSEPTTTLPSMTVKQEPPDSPPHRYSPLGTGSIVESSTSSGGHQNDVSIMPPPPTQRSPSDTT